VWPQAAGNAALESLLLWLSTYSDLFTRPCDATGVLLAADTATQHLVPPVLRPFRLSRPALIAAARDAAARSAYHPFAAPLTDR
jgi:Mediator complex subunit 27